MAEVHYSILAYREVVMILILYVGITRAERKKIVSWIQTKMSKTKQ